MHYKSGHQPLQFRLSTAVVMTLVVGLILGLNLHSSPGVRFIEVDGATYANRKVCMCGWPAKSIIIDLETGRAQTNKDDPFALPVNTMVFIDLLFLTGIILEPSVRHSKVLWALVIAPAVMFFGFLGVMWGYMAIQ